MNQHDPLNRRPHEPPTGMQIFYVFLTGLIGWALLRVLRPVADAIASLIPY
jgi:hypothetical protein